jgi:hypothetical protein
MKLVVRNTFWQIDGEGAGPDAAVLHGRRRSMSLGDMATATDPDEKLGFLSTGCDTPPTSASASSSRDEISSASDVSPGEFETDGELDVVADDYPRERQGSPDHADGQAMSAQWTSTENAWTGMCWVPCWVQVEPSMVQPAPPLEANSWSAPFAEKASEALREGPEKLPPRLQRFERRSRKEPNKEKVQTTLMIKNLPAKCSRSVLMWVLDTEGFAGEYDFVYVPTNLRRAECCGYAFVNATSQAVGERMLERMQGFDQWDGFGISGPPLEAVWSESMQGLDAHVERYRNSPMMRPEVPDECKPLLLQNGQAVCFPAPTKRLKALRLRRGASDNGPRELANGQAEHEPDVAALGDW